MKTKERQIERRRVIEEYARYDCSKKGRALPDFSAWDWTGPDQIDQALRQACLKCGVLAGYRLWDCVELTVADLRRRRRQAFVAQLAMRPISLLSAL